MPKKTKKTSATKTSMIATDENMEHIITLLEQTLIRILDDIEANADINTNDIQHCIRMAEILTRARKNHIQTHQLLQTQHDKKQILQKIHHYGTQSGLNDTMLKTFLEALDIL